MDWREDVETRKIRHDNAWHCSGMKRVREESIKVFERRLIRDRDESVEIIFSNEFIFGTKKMSITSQFFSHPSRIARFLPITREVCLSLALLFITFYTYVHSDSQLCFKLNIRFVNVAERKNPRANN